MVRTICYKVIDLNSHDDASPAHPAHMEHIDV